ncbi:MULTISPECIES: MFS transporter [unclassified Curtobacterium]|uniref:MFS transporter n=1 Tax=unclassified Curtobacterium TaxID=257496 RepID=UPI000D969322|nr:MULTISPECIES: MFS transporter [unclassified Curtobacterium]PYY39600.1 MFS transporter [Curtobacterium sp. MCPF17_046]WIB15592.1 MFS transporter [Curtobacterium sp. MCPF17_050]
MTTAGTRPAPTTRAWRNAVFVVFTLSGLDIATWLGRVPSVRDSLDASTFTMGLLVLGMSVGSIAGLTFAGHIVARLGARRGVLVAAACLALGMVAAGIAVTMDWGFAAIWICLIAFGFGNGLCDVSMNVSGATAERLGGRTIMPLFHAAFSVGTLAGAGIGALAERFEVPVALHFVVVGVITSLAMLVAIRWFGEDRHVEPEPTDTSPVALPVSRWAIWKQPSTLLIGVVVLGMALAEGSANDWLPLAMIDGHGLANDGGSAVLAVFLAAMTVGRVAGSPLIDRFGRVPVLRASAVVAVVGLGMLIFVPNVPIAIVGVVLWGLGASLGFPMGMSAAADDPRTAAAKVSAVATIGYVAFLAGPPIIGFAGEHVGLLNGLLIVFVFIIAAGLASGAARERTATTRPGDGRTGGDPGLPGGAAGRAGGADRTDTADRRR